MVAASALAVMMMVMLMLIIVLIIVVVMMVMAAAAFFFIVMVVMVFMLIFVVIVVIVVMVMMVVLMLVIVVIIVMMVVTAAALLIVIMMVMMTLFYLLKELFSHIIRRFLDDLEKLLTCEFVDRSCDDGCLRVFLADHLYALGNLIRISDIGTAQYDRSSTLDLIIEELTKVLHVHLALLSVNDCHGTV